jgi:DnaJ-class molecular chaperone
MLDYYKILGVSNNASYNEIKLTYRILALLYDPHINKSSVAAERFIEIKEANEILTDKNSRISYDFAYKVYYDSKKRNKIETGTKFSFWILWLIIAFISSSGVFNKNETTSGPPHKYIVDQEIFETNSTKSNNISFVNNDKTVTISDPLANRFLTELSKSQILAYGRADR